MEYSHRKILPKPNAITVEMRDEYPYWHPPPPPPPPCPPPSHHRHSHLMSPLVMLVFSLLGLAFIFISYLTIAKQRRVLVDGSVRSGDNGGDVGLDQIGEEFVVDEESGLVVDHPIWFIRTVGLEQSVIDSIQVFKYSRGEKLIDGSGGCSVCLSEFEDDENLRLLPKCNHAFHVPCIDTWLRAHKNCPMCRAPVVSENGNVTPVDPDSNEEGSGEARIDSDNVENVDQVGESATGEMRDENNEVEDDEDIYVGHKISCYPNERVQSDLGDNRGGVEEEVQAIRRSVSMSSPSASIIYSAMANVLPPIECEGCLATQPVPTERPNPFNKMEKVHKRTSSIIYKRVMKSSSFGRSMRRSHYLFKRSYSSSSKRFEACRRGSQYDATLPF